jgi:hypothetical protein
VASTCSGQKQRKKRTPQGPPTLPMLLLQNPPKVFTSFIVLAPAQLFQGALTTTAKSSTAIAVAPPSMLKGKTIEEIVNGWTSDLESNVREFNKLAAEVAVWDRTLIENSNNVSICDAFQMVTPMFSCSLQRYIAMSSLLSVNKPRLINHWIISSSNKKT